jgi:RND family efflux transporter MFP subunit
MKTMHLLAAIVIFTVLVITLGCSSQDETAKVEEIEMSGKIYVQTAPAEQRSIQQYLEFPGKIEAIQEAYISPGISMRIVDILVAEGDRVQKGQLLVLMDDAHLQQAEAQFVATQKDYQRMQALRDSGSISQQAYDQVEAGYKAAKAAYELLKSNTEIKAPFSGVITAKYQNPGEYFNSMSSPGILRLVNLDRLKAKINVSDKNIPMIKKGQSANIFVDSHPNEIFTGSVSYVASVADPLSGTFTCEITFENRDNMLRPGQYAKLQVVLYEKENAIVVPQTAVVNSNIVYVIKGGKAYRRDVVLGVQNEDEVEILEGIEPGEMVVIAGNVGLRDGAEVEER